MNDSEIRRQPSAIVSILDDTTALGFNMASESKVGSMLAALAASKPGSRFLELGTGTGHGTAWLLAGMDGTATLDTVDTDPNVVAVAQRHLGSDSRVTFHVMDGAQFLQESLSSQFDFIYADAWPGKFSHLDEALSRLRPGGMYVIDDPPRANNLRDNLPREISVGAGRCQDREEHVPEGAGEPVARGRAGAEGRRAKRGGP